MDYQVAQRTIALSNAAEGHVIDASSIRFGRSGHFQAIVVANRWDALILWET